MAFSRLFLAVHLAALCTLHFVFAEQTVFRSPEPQLRTGTLLGFEGGGRLSKRVLDVAKAHDLDVWRAAHDRIDIYLPGNASLPQELALLDHHTSPIFDTPRTSHTLGSWNITTLKETTFHESYHPLGDIEGFLRQLNDAYPNITRVIDIGRTSEQREMYGFTLSVGGYDEEEDGDEEDAEDGRKKKKKKKRLPKSPVGNPGEKLGFVLLGAQHAREWVATSAALYLAQALAAADSEPHSLSGLLKHFDFHIIPVPNPDGYAYTWDTDRYWYKNRQGFGPHTKCTGIDMNRNWGYKWKPEAQHPKGIKPDPCSHWYPGSRPFESPEVNNIANWVSTLPNVVGFVDLRSYGQTLSTPYSHSCSKVAPDAEDQIEAALGASQAIKHCHGSEFEVGNLCTMLYPAPGNVLDWMYQKKNVKYSYVAHLRDTGTYGFTLPPTWIRPTAEEASDLISYLARFIAKQAKREF